jgi:hypothetical protein
VIEFCICSKNGAKTLKVFLAGKSSGSKSQFRQQNIQFGRKTFRVSQVIEKLLNFFDSNPEIISWMDYFVYRLLNLSSITYYFSSLMPYLSSLVHYFSSMLTYLSSLIAYLSSILPYLSSISPYLSSILPYFSSLMPYFFSISHYFSSLTPYFSSLVSYFSYCETWREKPPASR